MNPSESLILNRKLRPAPKASFNGQAALSITAGDDTDVEVTMDSLALRNLDLDAADPSRVSLMDIGTGKPIASGGEGASAQPPTVGEAFNILLKAVRAAVRRF